MNTVLDAMKERRSIRAFKAEAVPRELIDKIVEAGTFAPSGMNRQAAIIIAITDKEVRDSLSADNAAVFEMTGDPFYGAPVVLAVLARKDCRTYIYDGSLVMGNLMLAAHSLGLGSCWIHRAKETFEMPKWKAYLDTLGIVSEAYEGIGNCIIGYPAQNPAPKPRKENYVYYN